MVARQLVTDLALDLSPADLPKPRGSLPAQVADILRQRIASGAISPGAQLPSEPKLAEAFKVSRNTVREAIRLLRTDGVLVARRGAGTFVRAGTPHAWPVETGIEALESTSEMLRRAGHEPGCRGYSVEVVEARGDVAGALGLDPGAPAYRLSRVRLAGDQPVIHCEDYIPAARVDNAAIRRYDGSGSLFAFLAENCGLEVHVARAAITPVHASPAVAQALGVGTDVPLLLLAQTHFDPETEPFLYSENVLNPTFFAFHVRRMPRAVVDRQRLTLLDGGKD
jgi:GntR family transcriptional regulator